MKLPALILLGLILSCSPGADSPAKTVRIALPTEPPTLDWNIATDNVSYQVLNQLMEGLAQFDADLNAVPAAASSWEVRDGGTTYVFRINPDYRWSDGAPLTARHFRDSWIRLLQPETASEYAYFLFDIVGARDFNAGRVTDAAQVGIEATDDATFTVRLAKPVVFFPAITTFMVTFPVRLDLIEKHGSHWTEAGKLVTCGPYALEEWWHEYRLKLKRNPYYGGSPKPQIERIHIFLVNEPSTVLSLYERGQLDVAHLPPIALPRYQNHPDRIHSSKLRGYYYGFNTQKPPFNDVRVRQALGMALDKREIPPLLKGGEQAVNSWIPPGMFGFNAELGLRFDPEKAKGLLEQAGFGPGRPLSGAVLSFNSDATNKKIAEWAQAQWKRHLGIEVALDNQEWKSYLSRMKHDPPGMFRMGWGADYPDPDNFMNLFTSHSGNNHTRWKSEVFDRLIQEGASAADPARRRAIYDRAQRLLLEEDSVILPLFVPAQHLLAREKLKPFPILPLDFLYYKRVPYRE